MLNPSLLKSQMLELLEIMLWPLIGNRGVQVEYIVMKEFGLLQTTKILMMEENMSMEHGNTI